jgi:hypothetical protein
VRSGRLVKKANQVLRVLQVLRAHRVLRARKVPLALQVLPRTPSELYARRGPLHQRDDRISTGLVHVPFGGNGPAGSQTVDHPRSTRR